MKFWWMFLLFVPVFAEASPALSRLGRCDYYVARERGMGCGPGGYLMAFGDRYCRRFDAASSRFSEEGRAIVGRIKVCLQWELERTAGLNCGNVKSIAFESHVGCYARAQFCRMSFVDKMILFGVVAPALADPDLRLVAGRLGELCRGESL